MSDDRNSSIVSLSAFNVLEIFNQLSVDPCVQILDAKCIQMLHKRVMNENGEYFPSLCSLDIAKRTIDDVVVRLEPYTFFSEYYESSLKAANADIHAIIAAVILGDDVYCIQDDPYNVQELDHELMERPLLDRAANLLDQVYLLRDGANVASVYHEAVFLSNIFMLEEIGDYISGFEDYDEEQILEMLEEDIPYVQRIADVKTDLGQQLFEFADQLKEKCCDALWGALPPSDDPETHLDKV